MPQIFHRATNVIAWTSLFGGVFVLALVTWAAIVYTRSSYGTGMGKIPAQPVPFSHEHHVGVLGIDCRYCHTSVEISSFAVIPPTKTCMNCHSQIWVNSAPVLERVHASYRTGQSLPWQRVYNVPGFVYFDHTIHVQKGIGWSRPLTVASMRARKSEVLMARGNSHARTNRSSHDSAEAIRERNSMRRTTR